MDQITKFHERISLEGVRLVIPETQRALAFATLSQNVFPTTRTEAWKYTRTARIANAHFAIQNYT